MWTSHADTHFLHHIKYKYAISLTERDRHLRERRDRIMTAPSTEIQGGQQDGNGVEGNEVASKRKNKNNKGLVNESSSSSAEQAHDAGEGVQDVEDEGGAKASDAQQAAKKKRKKKKKPTGLHSLPELDNSEFRCLSNWPAIAETRQTFPPSVPIHEVYPDGDYPIGEIQDYVGGSYRTPENEEKDRARILDYQNIRRAAECHRQVSAFL